MKEVPVLRRRREGQGPEAVVMGAMRLAHSQQGRAGEVIRKIRTENEDLYRLEELLENGGELPAELVER